MIINRVINVGKISYLNEKLSHKSGVMNLGQNVFRWAMG